MQAIIHEHHSFFATHLNGVFHLVKLILANEIADSPVGNEQFIREHAAGAVGGGQQFLGDDSYERIRQLHHNLTLRISVEHADDALNRL